MVQRRWLLLLELLLLAGLCVWLGLTLFGYRTQQQDSIDIKIQLRDAKDRALLHREPDGRHVYILTLIDGRTERLNAEDFARRMYDDQKSRSWSAVMLNVTSPVGFIWVSVGLLGQVLFTGRMLVQWLASEKEKKSVVPPVFWWMSLIGSTMLLIYFAWRLDPVGLLGQAFGWFVYIRNLYLIYAHQNPSPSVSEDPAPEPEMEK